MTRTPPEPPEEELDELDDEAIVAQQSAAHAPQRRAQVKVESRSVVVAEEDAEATRQLEVYDEGRSDPTVVVRDRERRALANTLQQLPSHPPGKSRIALVIWAGAGLLAIGLGAVLGKISSGGGTSVVSVAPAASPAPAPAPAASQADDQADAPAATADAAAPSASAAEPALDLDQLPVEHHEAKATSHRPVRVKRRPPKKSAPTTSPEKGGIPSGI